MQKLPKRILLKISGETFMGSAAFGIDDRACESVAQQLKILHDSGIQVSLVIGGGNIFRGIHLASHGLKRTPADQMGMLATLINGIALRDYLESAGVKTKVMTALECPKVAETFNWYRAMEALDGGTLLIFVGGTGNPYFTTDTAAAVRACETQADLLLKATKVDGIYDKDPLKYADAVKFDSLSYSEFLTRKLEVMDATSVALCRANQVPILVFNKKLLEDKKLIEVLSQDKLGTIVKGD